MTQYEIWWAELPIPIGRRPVLLLTRSRAYDYLTSYLAAEVTHHIRGLAVEVPLGRTEGLERRSVANLDNLRMVHRKRLIRRIGALPRSRVPEVQRALGSALDWSELK